MWTPSLPEGGRPIYLAIADAIAEDVRTGLLPPGARLPPQRRLAEALAVDFTTVSRAYAEARRRGLVSSRVGRGTFVARPAADYVPRLPGSGPLDMSMNLPPLIDDPAATEGMRGHLEALMRENGPQLLLAYNAPGGGAEDRAAGVAWLGRTLPGAALERTLVAAGAQPAIFAAMSEVADPGDVICVGALTYPGGRAAARRLGLALAPVAMDADGLLPEAFEAVCREKGPKALYYTCTLENPTTATLPLERREAIVRIARRYRVALIEDDAYGLLPETAPPPLAALAPDITYYIAGLAKPLSPALRIAYLAAPDAGAAARLAATLGAITGMASPFTAALASRWIHAGVAERVLRAIRAETQARRRIAGELLGAAAAAPAAAFHLWLPLPEGWSRAAFQGRLARQGVAVVLSDAFAVGPEAPEAVRIGLGCAAPRDSVRRALGVVAEALRGPPDWDLPFV
jgi:DNA-binding transcriptional MocR family regulator